MKRLRLFVLLPILGLLTLSCYSFGFIPTPTSPYAPYDCPPLPETFTEADLIGTWVASYFLHDKDTLIIRANGTYKQIYNDPDSGLQYESDWQEWWIEHRPSGFLRLHLEGMRRCDDITSLCLMESGGLTQDDWGVDECENETIRMAGEVVLIVTGVPERYRDVPRRIELRHARLAGMDYYFTFRLKEPKE